MTPEPEIVKITADGRLIDSDSYERSIRRSTMDGLPKGYYVVTWPEKVDHPRYDDAARFDGPFGDYDQALAKLANANVGEIEKNAG